MLDSEGRLNKQYTNDGLHLTGDGYLVWKKLLLDKQLL
jgi:lysophospholipase L1-like esterase